MSLRIVFVAVVGLCLSLPHHEAQAGGPASWIGLGGNGYGGGYNSKLKSGHPGSYYNAFARWMGYGYSDGYHTCDCGPGAGSCSTGCGGYGFSGHGAYAGCTSCAQATPGGQQSVVWQASRVQPSRSNVANRYTPPVSYRQAKRAVAWPQK